MASSDNHRFEAIEEPMGGWMVWDNMRDFPAEFGEIVLVGLTGATAAEMTDVLNDAAAERREGLRSCPPHGEVIAMNLWRRSDG